MPDTPNINKTKQMQRRYDKELGKQALIPESSDSTDGELEIVGFEEIKVPKQPTSQPHIQNGAAPDSEPLAQEKYAPLTAEQIARGEKSKRLDSNENKKETEPEQPREPDYDSFEDGQDEDEPKEDAANNQPNENAFSRQFRKANRESAKQKDTRLGDQETGLGRRLTAGPAINPEQTKRDPDQGQNEPGADENNLTPEQQAVVAEQLQQERQTQAEQMQTQDIETVVEGAEQLEKQKQNQQNSPEGGMELPGVSNIINRSKTLSGYVTTFVGALSAAVGGSMVITAVDKIVQPNEKTEQPTLKADQLIASSSCACCLIALAIQLLPIALIIFFSYKILG